MDLVHPHRLVFEPRRSTVGAGDATDRDTGGVTAITIVEVIDYH